MMTRAAARENAVLMVYAFPFVPLAELLEDRLGEDFYVRVGAEDEIFASPPNEEECLYIEQIVNGTYEHLPELDSYIEKYAVGWKFSRIPRMAVAVMRVAMYEVLYRPDIPNGAALNEAVEIAKHYEPADVVRFVNGILGTFMEKENPA